MCSAPVPLNHDQIFETLPDFALGSLDDDSATTISEHVAGCPACRDELQLWQITVDQLALAIPPQAPPADLHQRLMQRVAPPQAPPPVQPTWLAWLRRNPPVWAAAMILLVGGLLVSNLNLRRQLAQYQQTSAPMIAIPMLSAQPATAASGVVVVSADGEYGTLVVQHLPELPAEKVYQLWLIQNGQRASGGIFTVDEHGYTALEIESPQHLNQYDAFGVTIEPAGGSSGPTGPKVLGSSP
jgi:anti-sigma-K factor RskA